MFERADVLQRCLDLYENPSYLEIGVNRGETFSRLKAAHKVGVDPNLLLDPATLEQNDRSAKLFEVESDTYFGTELSKGWKFDVIFLDGLHVFEQTLRDLMNAVWVLKPGGIVVVDDVLPVDYVSSLTDFNEIAQLRVFLARQNPLAPIDGSWMGDIYKIPFFVQNFMQSYSYATVAENHGQTVIWEAPRPPQDIPRLSMKQITDMQLKDMVLLEASMRRMWLADIMAEIAASR